MARRVRKRVLLMTIFEDSYIREVVGSVAQSPEAIRGWDMHSAGVLTHEQAVDCLRSFEPDGVMVRSANEPWYKRYVLQAGLPAVELGCPSLKMPAHSVVPDNAMVGEMAAEFFLSRGFHHFAFLGNPMARAILRRQGFVRRLDREGCSCNIYEQALHHGSGWSHRERVGQVARWASTLERCTAVMAGDESMAHRFLDACRSIDREVPGDLAVLTCGNDELRCHLVTPALSSVQLDGERTGRKAALLLDRLMRGGKPPRQATLVAPLGIIERQSTDTVASEDPTVIRAIRHIREQCHQHQRTSVKELAAAVGTSRRSLERRFSHSLSRSPALEIRRQRLNEVRQQLEMTDMTVIELSRIWGYATSYQLIAEFRKQMGVTPQRYRRERRGGAAKRRGACEGKTRDA